MRLYMELKVEVVKLAKGNTLGLMLKWRMFNNIVEFSSLTRTAQEAADQIGCTVAQIAKSLIFKDESGSPVLVIASGINRVDVERLKLFKADADFVKEKTGFVIGGVPPYGHKEKIKTLIDEDLKQYAEIWAAAGKSNAVFKTNFEELVEKSGGKVEKIK